MNKSSMIFLVFVSMMGLWSYPPTMNKLLCHAKSIGSNDDSVGKGSVTLLNLFQQIKRQEDEYPEVVSVKIPTPSLLESIEMPNIADGLKKMGKYQKLLPGINPCILCFWNEFLWTL